MKDFEFEKWWIATNGADGGYSPVGLARAGWNAARKQAFEEVVEFEGEITRNSECAFYVVTDKNVTGSLVGKHVICRIVELSHGRSSPQGRGGMMSTEYKEFKDVPIDAICKRLEELSYAVTKGKDAINREFSMRVPAELDRDADIVLSIAAKRLTDLTAALNDATVNAESARMAFEGHLSWLRDELAAANYMVEWYELRAEVEQEQAKKAITDCMAERDELRAELEAARKGIDRLIALRQRVRWWR